MWRVGNVGLFILSSIHLSLKILLVIFKPSILCFIFTFVQKLSNIFFSMFFDWSMFCWARFIVWKARTPRFRYFLFTFHQRTGRVVGARFSVSFENFWCFWWIFESGFCCVWHSDVLFVIVSITFFTFLRMKEKNLWFFLFSLSVPLCLWNCSCFWIMGSCLFGLRMMGSS